MLILSAVPPAPAVTHYYIVNLAVADLLLTSTVLPCLLPLRDPGLPGYSARSSMSGRRWTSCAARLPSWDSVSSSSTATSGVRADILCATHHRHPEEASWLALRLGTLFGHLHRALFGCGGGRPRGTRPSARSTRASRLLYSSSTLGVYHCEGHHPGHVLPGPPWWPRGRAGAKSSSRPTSQTQNEVTLRIAAKKTPGVRRQPQVTSAKNKTHFSVKTAQIFAREESGQNMYSGRLLRPLLAAFFLSDAHCWALWQLFPSVS